MSNIGNDSIHQEDQLENPPIIELALSAQFQMIPQFNASHWARYWHTIDNEWVKAEELPPLKDEFESFPSTERRFDLPTMKIEFSQSPSRFAMTTADEVKLLQLQSSRFILNWRKRSNVTLQPSPVES